MKDQNGKNIDFRNIILILTTNAGASDLEKNEIGFDKKKTGIVDINSINKLFSPEFRNRLDAIINFNKLEKEYYQPNNKQIYYAT